MNCSNCGQTNPPGKKFCRQCGTLLKSVSPSVSGPRQQVPAMGGTPCARCGAHVSAGKAFCTQCGTSVKTASAIHPAPEVALPGSIQAGLAELGIRFSRRKLIGFGLSVASGMVMARILPYIYPVAFGPLLDRVFGPGPGARDVFNSHMMTAITFLTSFVISFIAFRRPRSA